MRRTVLAILVGLALASLASTEDGAAQTTDHEAALTGKWHVHLVIYPDGEAVALGVAGPYFIEFSPHAVVSDGPDPDGRIDFTANCISGSADYYVEGSRLRIVRLVTTRIGCCLPLPSDEEFTNLLLAVTSFAVVNDELVGDELVLFVEDGTTISFFPEEGTPQAG